MSEQADLRRRVRHRPRARPRRRALGADDRARAAARAQALHRPPRRPPPRRARRARPAPARARAGADVVQQRRLPPPLASQVYELTDCGRDARAGADRARPLGRRQRPAARDEHGMSLDAHIVSLRTLFDPDAAPATSTARVELRLGERALPRRGRRRRRSTIGAASCRDADAIDRRPTRATLIDVLHGHRPLADALRAGDLRDRAATSGPPSASSGCSRCRRRRAVG